MGVSSSSSAQREQATGDSPEEGLIIFRRRIQKLEKPSASPARIIEKALGIVSILKKWPTSIPPNEAYLSLNRVLDKVIELGEVNVAAEVSFLLLAPASRGYGADSTQLAEAHLGVAMIHIPLESWDTTVAHCQAAYPLLMSTRGERWLSPTAEISLGPTLFLLEHPPKVEKPSLIQPLARLPVGQSNVQLEGKVNAPPPIVRSPPLPGAPEGSDEPEDKWGCVLGCMDVLRMLVVAYAKLGQKELALSTALRHLHILESMYGRFHISTLPGVRSYFIAAILDGKSKDLRVAVDTAKCVIALSERAYGKNHVYVADAFEQLAWVYLFPGDIFSIAKASSLTERARIVRTLSGEDMTPNDELRMFVQDRKAARDEGTIDDKGREMSTNIGGSTNEENAVEEVQQTNSESSFFDSLGGVPREGEALEGVGEFLSGYVSDAISFLISVTDQL